MARMFKTSVVGGSVVWSGTTTKPIHRNLSSSQHNFVHYIVRLVSPLARTAYCVFNEDAPVPLLKAMGVKVEPNDTRAGKWKAIGCQYSEFFPNQWEAMKERYAIPQNVLDFYASCNKLDNTMLEVLMPSFEEPEWTISGIKEGIGVDTPVPEDEGWIAI